MSVIDTMIDDVIRREGGFVDHPNDRGGPTNCGITIATLSEWLGKKATREDVQELLPGVAREIYRQRYYEDPKISELPERIQPLVFDSAVNHGQAMAIRMLQTICDEAGYEPGPIDGVIGPKTIQAATRYDRAMLDHLLAERKLFYQDIVENDPSQAVFMDGWLNRLKEFA